MWNVVRSWHKICLVLSMCVRALLNKAKQRIGQAKARDQKRKGRAKIYNKSSKIKSSLFLMAVVAMDALVV